MTLRGLYAITDSQLLAGRFLSHVEAALEGVSACCSTVTKAMTPRGACVEAQSLQRLCERYGTQLVINDDVELARTWAWAFTWGK
ncbi:hypothetical protein GTA26_27350, partial [Rhodococcus hoagii]|nr:hypothetical protein [Prescottella equi]